MRLMSFRATRRTLIRFVSASACRIALSATLTTPQPNLALQVVVDTFAQQVVPNLLAARQAGGRLAAVPSDHARAVAATKQPAPRAQAASSPPGAPAPAPAELGKDTVPVGSGWG